MGSGNYLRTKNTLQKLSEINIKSWEDPIIRKRREEGLRKAGLERRQSPEERN